MSFIDLKTSTQIQILLECAMYPKTKDIHNTGSNDREAILISCFDGNFSSFLDLVNDLEKSLDVRAMDGTGSIVCVLQIMATKAHESLMIGSIDCILIQRNGIPLIEINNTSKGSSSRSLVFEYNNIRDRAIEVHDRSQLDIFSFTFTFMIGFFLGYAIKMN